MLFERKEDGFCSSCLRGVKAFICLGSRSVRGRGSWRVTADMQKGKEKDRWRTEVVSENWFKVRHRLEGGKTILKLSKIVYWVRVNKLWYQWGVVDWSNNVWEWQKVNFNIRKLKSMNWNKLGYSWRSR